MTYETAKQRASRAFLLGRIKRGLHALWIPLLMAGVAFFLELEPRWVLSSIVLSTAWLFGSHLASHRLGNASYAGALIGLVPFGAGTLAPSIGHACAGNYCYEFCLGVCAVGGALAGGLALRYAQNQSERSSLLSTTAPLVITSGSLGCGCVGGDGVIAMILGLVVGALVVARRRVPA